MYISRTRRFPSALRLQSRTRSHKRPIGVRDIRCKQIGFLGNPGSFAPDAKGNTGNVIHGYAARRIFREWLPLKIDPAPENIDLIRDRCSHIGYAAATVLSVNFTSRFADRFVSLAEFLEKVDLPICAFGLGSQASGDATIGNSEVDPRSVRLLQVLADRSEQIAVRGEFTADLCRKYGVNNVVVVGCQSVYFAASMNSDTAWTHRQRTGCSAASITPSFALDSLLNFLMRENVDLIGQGDPAEYRIARGGIKKEQFVNEFDKIWLPQPVRTALDQNGIEPGEYFDYISEHYQKFFNVPEWTLHLRESYDFVFGSRFHGNVAAMMAGVPALWLAHDMRTRELCNFLKLPWIPVERISEFSSIDELKQECDFSEFRRHFSDLSPRFLAYLEGAGVSHLVREQFANSLRSWGSEQSQTAQSGKHVPQK